MHAVDTNIIVRFIVDDDPIQSPRARKLIDEEDIFVPLTVILETEWVLRSAYKFPTSRITAAIAALAGLDRVTLQNPQAVSHAIALCDAGIDFADALHVCTSPTPTFLTFDTKFARQAKTLGLAHVTTMIA